MSAARHCGERLGPYLAISRQAGAGGSELARRMGHDLGWPVLGKQLVDRVSERFHVDRAILEPLDETKVGFLQELFGQIINQHLVSQVGYVHWLRRTLLAAVSSGPAVIVGHGSQFILPRQRGLVVRVVAEKHDRLQRICRKYGVTRFAARRHMTNVDGQRKSFARAYFHRDLDDAVNYDLVINSSHLEIDRAAEFVSLTLRSRFLDECQTRSEASGR
jgi:cytidylate kinase